MGFFTRNREGDDDVPVQRASRSAAEAGGARRRTAAGGRDQADELRRRARRRLVGAIAMVLVAVIVLPIILDGEPEPTHDNLSVQAPSQTPSQPNLAVVTPPPAESTGRVGQEGGAPAVSGEVVDPRVPASIASITPLGQDGRPLPPAATPPAQQQPQQPPAAQTPPAKPAPSKPEPSKPAANTQPPPPPPPAAQPRTPPNAAAAQKEAEAARALALLQGKPVPPAPSASTNNARSGAERFAVQVVAVRSREGADQLLSRLRGAGLTAYIETITTPDGQVHRVRLGPYNSRSQAESAQAKLRGLPGGYGGSLVPL